MFFSQVFFLISLFPIRGVFQKHFKHALKGIKQDHFCVKMSTNMQKVFLDANHILNMKSADKLADR